MPAEQGVHPAFAEGQRLQGGDWLQRGRSSVRSMAGVRRAKTRLRHAQACLQCSEHLQCSIVIERQRSWSAVNARAESQRVPMY